MISAFDQATTMIIWLVIIKFCQITIYPYLKSALGGLSYGLAYPAGIMVLTFLSWYIALIGLPVQLVILPFAAAGIYALRKKMYMPDELKKSAIWDVIFLASFILMLIIQLMHPAIALFIGERYMDASFIGSIMNSPVISPLDPWYAGGDLSVYYYLGHWMIGVIGILCGGASTVIFNLAVPTVFALCIVSAYAIGKLLIKRDSWIPAVVIFLSTPALYLLYCLYAVGGYLSIDAIRNAWWMSAHIYSLNEYPIWSLIYGDPHADVFSFFSQLFFICLLAIMLTKWSDLSKNGQYLLVLLLALTLGSMPGIQTWDIMVYAPLYLAVGFYVWYTREKHEPKKILPFILVPVLAILAYAPLLFWMFTGDGTGMQILGIVTNPTSLIDHLAIFGVFTAIIFIYSIPELKKYPLLIIIPIVFAILGYLTVGVLLLCIALLLAKKSDSPAIIFGIAGLAVLFAVEFLYMESAGNTQFKLGLCAWMLLSVSIATILGGWFAAWHKKHQEIYKIATAALVVICLAGVIIGVLAMNGNIDNYGYTSWTLDGGAWLDDAVPTDAAGIAYLNQNALPGDIVVEAATESHDSYAGRVTAMTGLPVIIGWPHHESLLRSDTDSIYERVADVKAIYEDPSQTLDLMDKYGAKYLFVGEMEKAQYNITLPRNGLVEKFSENGVYIFERQR